MDQVGLGQALAVEPHLDVAQVEGVVTQLDLLADEEAGDGVAVALEVDVAGSFAGSGQAW